MRRALTALFLAAPALLVAGCGIHHPNLADANNNGSYVEAGPVTYQLQISRELNPYSEEDSGYVAGVPKSEASLAPDQEWYGVFLWAKNQTKQPQTTTDSFEIIDTQGNVYHPVKVNNPYAWTSRTLAPGAVQPNPNTTAGFGPTGGGLVLFKIYSSGYKSAYSNRPLTLEIRGGPLNKVWAAISLDL